MGFRWANQYKVILNVYTRYVLGLYFNVFKWNIYHRPYWRCYYSNTDAVIYVVDSVDKDRMQTSREELHAMLEEEELKDAALLVFANKQDMEGALSAAEVADALGLSTLKNRQYSIYRTSALKGEGLTEGLDWLVNIIQENKK